MRALELACAVIVAVYLVTRALGDPQPRRFVLRYGVLALAGLIGEDSVIRAYGFYFYSPRWDLFVDRVPLLIVLIWPVVIHSAWDLARALCRTPALMPLAGAAIVLADASLIEPIAVQAGLWQWTEPGLFAVPPIGILGWAFFAAGAMVCLQRADVRGGRGAIGALAIVVAPVAAHALLLASWWSGLRWISRPLPSWPAVLAAWLVLGALTVAALRRRAGRRVPRAQLLLRVPGALFFFALLLLTARQVPSLCVYSVAFAPPYLALLLR